MYVGVWECRLFVFHTIEYTTEKFIYIEATGKIYGSHF